MPSRSALARSVSSHGQRLQAQQPVCQPVDTTGRPDAPPAALRLFSDTGPTKSADMSVGIARNSLAERAHQARDFSDEQIALLLETYDLQGTTRSFSSEIFDTTLSGPRTALSPCHDS